MGFSQLAAFMSSSTNKIFMHPLPLPQQKKIVVIGDSHARGLASALKNCIGHEYSVSGTIMPGARLNNITQLANLQH